jgi:hypothetical protein
MNPLHLKAGAQRADWQQDPYTQHVTSVLRNQIAMLQTELETALHATADAKVAGAFRALNCARMLLHSIEYKDPRNDEDSHERTD